MIKPEQVLNYLLVEYELAEEKRFDMTLLVRCRSICEKCGLDINDTLHVQRALIGEILEVSKQNAHQLLDSFESWVRAEKYVVNDYEKEFAITVQNTLREELKAKL